VLIVQSMTPTVSSRAQGCPRMARPRNPSGSHLADTYRNPSKRRACARAGAARHGVRQRSVFGHRVDRPSSHAGDLLVNPVQTAPSAPDVAPNCPPVTSQYRAAELERSRVTSPSRSSTRFRPRKRWLRDVERFRERSREAGPEQAFQRGLG